MILYNFNTLKTLYAVLDNQWFTAPIGLFLVILGKNSNLNKFKLWSSMKLLNHIITCSNAITISLLSIYQNVLNQFFEIILKFKKILANMDNTKCLFFKTSQVTSARSLIYLFSSTTDRLQCTISFFYFIPNNICASVGMWSLNNLKWE